MLERIVVAVDGSTSCEPALNYAVNLTRQSCANLTGVFVVGSESPGVSSKRPDQPEVAGQDPGAKGRV